LDHRIVWLLLRGFLDPKSHLEAAYLEPTLALRAYDDLTCAIEQFSQGAPRRRKQEDGSHQTTGWSVPHSRPLCLRSRSHSREGEGLCGFEEGSNLRPKEYP